MYTGVCDVVGVILTFFLFQAVDEPKGYFIPFLREQHQQKPNANDDGGSQPHYAEDHFVLQQIHSCEEETTTPSKLRQDELQHQTSLAHLRNLCVTLWP